MVSLFRLSEQRAAKGQDHFFLWSMVILPILAQCTYIFDAYYYLAHRNIKNNGYEGLLSTILIVFAYLRYCSPIESRVGLFVYYILLCILGEIANIGYIITFVLKKDIFFTLVYCCWGMTELFLTVMLIYCRIIMRYQVNFIVENKHLFHFMSRLEIILAIFIRYFISKNFTTLTKDSVAFFLLFDFFSDSYIRFESVWIKSTLYIFVTTVTTAVTCEWLYFSERKHIFEQVSAVSELISACLCNLLIVLQFFPYHFTPIHLAQIARDGFSYQKQISTIAMKKAENQYVDIEKAEKNDYTYDTYF